MKDQDLDGLKGALGVTPWQDFEYLPSGKLTVNGVVYYMPF